MTAGSELPMTRGTPGHVYSSAAPHYQGRLADLAEALYPRLAAGGPLHHLAHCTDGLVDFAINVRSISDEYSTNPEIARHWAFRAVDRQLCFSLAQLNRRLTAARTGSLTRLVLLTARGAFLCGNALPGEYLIGAVVIQDNQIARLGEVVETADQALSAIEQEFRQRVGAAANEQPPGSRERTDMVGPPRHHHSLVAGERSHPLVPFCDAALSPEHLHFIGIYHSGSMQLSVDILHDAVLSELFAIIDVPVRRHFYQQLGRECGGLVGDLGRIVRRVVNSDITQLSLGLEQGAIFFFPLGESRYLMAVTLDSSEIDVAEQKASQLAAELSRKSNQARPESTRNDQEAV